MGILRLKPDPLFGLDISSTAVKLLELSKAGKGYKVESYALEFLPEKAIEDKDIKDIEAVGQTIQRVINRAKPKAQHAAVAVSGPGVITKVIQQDKAMGYGERKAAIEVDAQSIFSSESVDDINMDFEVIGPNEKEPDDRVDVLVAGCRSEIVDGRVAALDLAKIKARVVDIEKYALENAFILVAETDPEIDENETIALVEVGATITTLNVLGNKKIIYTREEIFGGKQLTEEIQKTYGLSYEEANLAKRDGTLPDNYESDVLDPFKVKVAEQISRMIQYYYAASQLKLSHILVAGGCASIPGVIEQVNNKVGGHVTIVNPFAAMSVSPKVGKKALMTDAPALMIACGLALRSFDKINF